MTRERPLRIAHLIYGWTLGGLEQLVVQLCVEGRAAGLESLIISFGPDGPMRAAAGARGVPTRWIPSAGMRPSMLGEVHQALSTFDADVLHAHDLGPLLNGAAVCALRPGKPLVATFHQLESPTGAMRLAARAAAMRANALVACGSEVRTMLDTWLPGHPRVITIGNGVHLPPPPSEASRAHARERLGLPHDAIVVGYLGRMAEVKGPDLLLQAFLAAFANRAEVHLALVGPGPMEGILRAQAKGHANVHVLGAIVDARELLPGFDLYAQTSLTEGRSLAMLEAMAVGLPTIAHDLPGVREIHTASTARLVPLRHAEKLQHALTELVGDASLRARLGEAAMNASQRFDFNTTLCAYADLYRALALRAPLPSEVHA
ncbi:MAG: glycosyltransferase family 4 protein [Deltaproteobacteria bacterium]|nr:glycosyltransferase family 4 protein [Deltaproteobacteria bacterium]